MKKLIGLMVAGALFSFATGTLAVEINKLDSREAALIGATHAVTLTHDDLTVTNGATFAQVITAAVVAANSGIVPVAMVLQEPFNINSATTNAYNTTTMSVGDSASNTVFLTTTELNENGTEVYVKFATGASKVYTASNNLRFAFTGMTNESLAAYTKGRVKWFFRELKP